MRWTATTIQPAGPRIGGSRSTSPLPKRPPELTLVPLDFDVPHPPASEQFTFELLGPEHNEADLDAWGSSIDHIHATAGFSPTGWPERLYTPAENLADLQRHRDHSLRHLDFAWTVLDPTDPSTVIGCVYLKPDPTQLGGAEARSWVRADRSGLDGPLRDHLRPWFEEAWPLTVRYEG